MSLLNEVQKFIEAHPGVLPETLRMLCRLLTAARSAVSKQVTSEWAVAHRCEGDTRRHFPRLTERAQEPEPQPVRETRPVRNFYVGTNDPG